MNILTSQLLLEIVFVTIIFLHITKKNTDMAVTYGIQSLAIVAILIFGFVETGNIWILLVAVLALFAKVIMAPMFFTRLIQKHKLTFSVNSYLNTPLTFVAIAILSFIAHSQKFAPLTDIIPLNQHLLALALACLLLSLFLIVNRKGALSQVFGILSLENSIVAFSVFAGLEQSPALQIGIIFNICIWLFIATGFVSMIYKHFGTLDINSMKNLKD